MSVTSTIQNRSLSSGLFVAGQIAILVSAFAGFINNAIIPIAMALSAWFLLLPHGILEYKRASALAAATAEQMNGDDEKTATIQHMWYRSDQPNRNKALAVIFALAAFLQGLALLVILFSVDVGYTILICAAGLYLLVGVGIVSSTCCCCVGGCSLDVLGNNFVLIGYVFMFLAALDLRAHPNEFLGAFLVAAATILLILAGILFSISDNYRARPGEADERKEEGRRQNTPQV